MRLTQVWQVWAGALPLEGVFITEESAQAEADRRGGLTEGRFFRPRACWALQDVDGRLVLLPDGCEVVELNEVRV